MQNRELELLSDFLYAYFEKLNNNLEFLVECPVNCANAIELCFKTNDTETILNIVNISWQIYKKSKSLEEFELVTTNPSYKEIKTRKSYSVFNEILNNAKESILITGYSISSFADDLLEILLKKSKHGIKVSLFVNNLDEKRELLDKLVLFKGKYLEIFEFSNDKENTTKALHAKVILVDHKIGLISSSNLSYNGLIDNIEMGIKFDSSKKGEEIKQFFHTLIKKKVFTRV